MQVIEVPHGCSICEAPACSHNRWHPDIAPVLTVASGETVEIQTRDSLDGQIRRGMPAKDLADVTLHPAHVLTGPVYVEGAEPGDILSVHIEAMTTPDYGFTAIFPGYGLLSDLFPGPHLIHWDLHDGVATSAQLPGIVIPGAPFMGVMGLAPSRERLLAVNAREQAAAAAGAAVFPPDPRSAVPADPRIANEAWRTIASHEVGGNMDVRQLIAGSTLHLPVDVPGGLFSIGDAHFAQGDGESCGTAIETAGDMRVRFELRKGLAKARGQQTPSYEFIQAPGLRAERMIATTGLSIADDGRVQALDATVAARNALQEMIRWLTHERGLSTENAYCLASVAADLRLSSVVNSPYALVSCVIPESIFVAQ